MLTVHLRFPGGRYHATPSGHHVNEGLVEWPPSPWRLLRALIATGYATQGWTTVPDDARLLIEKLASVLPSYRLPKAVVAHSRHFMPLGALENGREKTTLVFDAWADLGQGTMAVRWDVTLSAAERALAVELFAGLGYLGRSESWIEATVAGDAEVALPGSDSFPCDDQSAPWRGYEQVAVTVPMTTEAYGEWRAELTAQALESLPLPSGPKGPSKKLLADRDKALAPFPNSLVDALQWDTARWKRHRWGQAPGSHRVLYWRAVDALELGAPRLRRVREAEAVSCMLLALATASRNRSALPTVARTLAQGDLLHRALISRAGSGDRFDCPELTGKDDLGQPLRGHRHAHVLPLDLDGDGHLDHVLIYAKMGLGARAQRAIQSLRRTWQKGGHDLEVVVIGAGELDALRELPGSLRPGIDRLLGPPEGACCWETATPFVPPRFLKRTGANDLPGQVAKELADHGHAAAEVVCLNWTADNARLRHAVRVRSGNTKPPPIDCGYPVRLVFDEPVRGPITLGYGSHYGLGLFHAV